MIDPISPLQKARREYHPRLPSHLQNLQTVGFAPMESRKEADPEIRGLFPQTSGQSTYHLMPGQGKGSRSLRVGAFFSGGQASGGHNVLAGLWDAIQKLDRTSSLIGFWGGSSGVIENRGKELKEADIASVRNQGGFDLIGVGRTKIETEGQMASILKTCRERKLDGLVVIGGDDSNTNAAVLAEYFLAQGDRSMSIIGIPKTIDGDLRSSDLEMSFGFDSACKTYAELIGNIARDALSAKKYYHFIKLMGRSASHITLECALATHPNFTAIAEERKSLAVLTQEIVAMIRKRKAAGKEYGILLIPEGLIEFVPEIESLIRELTPLLVKEGEKGVAKLSPASGKLFSSFPEKIQKQLLLDRDPHGNINVSKIDTQSLLMQLVKKELGQEKFSFQDHFFGYEGRACLPSNFDANYAYLLGHLGALAVRDRLTGVIAAVRGFKKKVDEWEMKMVPLTSMFHMEERKGKRAAVIQKTLVDLKGAPHAYLVHHKPQWELDDAYRYPGPIQFFGSPEIVDSIPLTLTF